MARTRVLLADPAHNAVVFGALAAAGVGEVTLGLQPPYDATRLGALIQAVPDA